MPKTIILTESQFAEMMAYHGSGSNFEKFNHKKYLNTGAGSQSFGWGTYVTDDVSVAKGYTNFFSYKDYDIWDDIYDGLIKLGVSDSEAIYMSHLKDELERIIKQSDEKTAADYLKNIIKKPKLYNATDNRIIEVKAMLYALECSKKKDAYLYEVDIPNNNGDNYIEWYEHFPSEFMKRVIYGMLRLRDKYLDTMAKQDYPFKCDMYGRIKWMKENPNIADEMVDILANEDNYDTFYSSGFYTMESTTEGRYVYNRLRTIFRSEKAASLFLMQCGFDGIKYPSGTKWNKPDGALEDAYNYVIFDSNKVKIVKKEVV